MNNAQVNKPEVEAKDVFISYRREDGATAARLLRDVLEHRQISTFFDTESIEGDFHQSIRDNLAKARNVVVVVSPRMFLRCLDANGNYDLVAVSQDWVYEEIRIALELGKNLVPVFVNGVAAFPPKLPDTIQILERQDAVNLDHNHFNSALHKLISRLGTRKNHFLGVYAAQDSQKSRQWLFDACLRLVPENDERIQKFLKDTLKNSWEGSSIPDKDVLEILLEGATLGFLKGLATDLELDASGGAARIQSNILSWLKHDKTVRLHDGEKESSDRLNDLIWAVSEYYRSPEHKKRMIETIESTFDIDLHRSKKSSWDVFESVFEQVDPADFFNEVNLPESDIKAICIYLGIDSTGRKRLLIDRIISYVNYDYSESDIEGAEAE